MFYAKKTLSFNVFSVLDQIWELSFVYNCHLRLSSRHKTFFNNLISKSQSCNSRLQGGAQSCCLCLEFPQPIQILHGPTPQSSYSALYDLNPYSLPSLSSELADVTKIRDKLTVMSIVPVFSLRKHPIICRIFYQYLLNSSHILHNIDRFKNHNYVVQTFIIYLFLKKNLSEPTFATSCK